LDSPALAAGVSIPVEALAELGGAVWAFNELLVNASAGTRIRSFR
jgi:hypothetical protein